MSESGSSGSSGAAESKPRVSQAAALLYQQGNQHAQAKRFAEAADLYRQAVADSPAFAEAHNNLANAQRLLGDLAGSVESYRRCLAIAPGAARVHRNLAATLLAMDRQPEARDSLQRVLELEPSDDETREMLRLVEASLSGAAPAAADPSSEAEFMYQQAVEAHARERLGDAERLLVHAVKLDPNHAHAWHLLGVVAYLCRAFEQASDFIERAIRLNAGDPRFYYDLGNVRLTENRFPEAIACYNQALRMQPAFFEAINNLGNALKKSGRLAEAESCYREAIALKPDVPVLRRNLAVVLLNQDKRPEALEVCRELLTITPDDGKIRYMASFLSGEGREAAPSEFLVSLFDEYAEKFEDHLTNTLGYQAPARMREAVDRILAGAKVEWNILDLGCGTGLCGRAFRDLARHITGVDLSPKMIDQARATGMYDALKTGELHQALADSPPVDLILAGDVLIYVGELKGCFSGSARALVPGGLLSFSTELEPGDSFTIRPTGRFTHSEAYVRAMAAECGLEAVACDEIVCRMEEGRPVPGQVFVLRKLA